MGEEVKKEQEVEKSDSHYRELDSNRILETTDRLQSRISERFPDSGLSRIAAELRKVVTETQATARWLNQPQWPIRLAVIFAILLVIGVGIGIFFTLDPKATLSSSISDFLQGLEAGINEFVFLGIAIYFLVNSEVRLKRKRAINALHVLRSMAHIIDMHQLTKDPERVVRTGADTQSSPKRSMTPFELTRYLDYCAELLAILSKVAALYVQHLNDPATLTAANGVEELTSGLSRKIWQKIMILDRILSQA
jgi:hypothetical protein